jgi:hypothetical protein
MVALLEQAAARSCCRFADDGILRRTKVYRFPTLLEAKGHLEVQRGDFAAAARTVTLYRRVAADLGRIPLNFEYGWFRVVIGLADEHAAEILIAIATAPGLDGEAAAAALAASSGPWEGSARFLCDADEFEEYFDVNCERALGSGDLARIDGTWWDMVGGDGESKGTAAGGNGEEAGHVLRVPTVDQLRVHRAALILRTSIDRRWEAAARAVDGRWREAFTSSPVRNGVPGSLDHPPPWFRGMMKGRARIAVARTAVAVRTFQLREGRAPAALDLLVPGTVAEVPVDPFDGKPLTYEAGTDGSWTVRSRAWPEESLTENGDPEPTVFVEAKFPRPPR